MNTVLLLVGFFPVTLTASSTLSTYTPKVMDVIITATYNPPVIAHTYICYILLPCQYTHNHIVMYIGYTF